MTLLIVAAALSVSVLWSSGSSGPTRDHPGSTRGLDARGPGRTASPSGEGPADFARNFAAALFSYDTGTSSRQSRQALLQAGSVTEGSPAAHDIDALVPNDAQWAQMAVLGQRATFAATSVRVPDLWRQTTAQHPELPVGAVGLTVTGTQHVVWLGGSSRAPLAVTLLLLCPPTTERCVVSRVPVQAAP